MRLLILLKRLFVVGTTVEAKKSPTAEHLAQLDAIMDMGNARRTLSSSDEFPSCVDMEFALHNGNGAHQMAMPQPTNGEDRQSVKQEL